MFKIYLESLGCVRNLVDSEIMLGRLVKAGHTVISEPERADIIIVNTCSFIESAATESIETILNLAEYKHKGKCQRLIVAGCLPQRFGESIVRSLPEVDIFLGTGAFDNVVNAAEKSSNNFKRKHGKAVCILPKPDDSPLQKYDAPRVKTFPHLAYIKIAEGCNRHCTYCIIPKLRGKQRSRHPDDIVKESRVLIDSGVKELVLVAQETTAYGKDLSEHIDLGMLIARISDICPSIWIRVLYGHPQSIDESFIQTVAKHENICSYFDIPIQHASNNVLKQMGRGSSSDNLLKLIERIREVVPQASLRTTVMVGFPGETSEDFETLMQFIEKAHFDHIGGFIYSDFDDLPSHRLLNHVRKDVAKRRYDQLMSKAMQLSLEHIKKYKDMTLKVLLDESAEPGLFVGRTSFQAPEADGVTYIRSGEELKIGDFVTVRIIDTLEYDMIGEAL